MLPVLRRQISDYLPASDPRTTLTRIPLYRLFLVASSLLPHLAHFLAGPEDCLCFCLRGSVGLVVGLAIGDAVSMAGEVAVGLSGWSL